MENFVQYIEDYLSTKDNKNMNKQVVYTTQVPAGCEMYNSPKPGHEVAGIMPSYVQSNTELAPPSGVEYVAAMPTCVGFNLKEERCRAPKAKGTDYCIGHLKRIEKEAKSKE
jgi:hypothetical protein